MILKMAVIILLALSLLLAPTFAYADWAKKPEFRLTSLFHCDLRQAMRNAYMVSISAAFSYLDDEGKTLLKLMPFLEARRNIRWDIWEKQSLGIEIGKDIFSWLYIGDAIQQVWAKENYHDWYIPLYVKRDYIESVTRLCFSHNLISAKNFKLKGFILDEFIFDFDRGAWLRNEVAIGFILPLIKNIEAKVNWGHIKRHSYDSDVVETSITLVF